MPHQILQLTSRVFHRWFFLATPALLIACGDEAPVNAPKQSDSTPAGGSARGGSTASHGGAGSAATASGGGTSGSMGVSGSINSNTGGAARGGMVGSGGSPSTGGFSANGGATSNGGDTAVGGATATGGITATGGANSGGSGGMQDTLAEQYPCSDSSAGYDVVLSGAGAEWTLSGGSQASASFSAATGGLAAALAAAYGRLSGTAARKATLLVRGSGAIDASAQLKMPSNFVLNLCGTIDVTGIASGSDKSPLYARDRTNIDIPHARVTGNAQYGMFFRNVPNLHLGDIEISLNKDTSGLGIRVDNNPNGGGPRVKNTRIDSVSITNTGGHGVEFYGADGITIGRFVGKGSHYCGLILNNSINAEVGSVRCDACSDAGTGYAAFRVANSNGNDGGSFPPGNIHVGEIYARGGDRGIFSVSGSGGLTVDRFDIAATVGTPILLQNCYNTTLGVVSGLIAGGEARISNDTTNTNNNTFARSSNTVISNTRLSGGASLREDWCDATDRKNRAINVSGGNVSMCHP